MELQDNPGNLNTEHEFARTIPLFTLNLPSYFLMKTTCYPELWTTQTFIISNYIFILLTNKGNSGNEMLMKLKQVYFPNFIGFLQPS